MMREASAALKRKVEENEQLFNDLEKAKAEIESLKAQLAESTGKPVEDPEVKLVEAPVEKPADGAAVQLGDVEMTGLGENDSLISEDGN